MATPLDCIFFPMKAQISESNYDNLISNLIMLNDDNIYQMVKARLKYGKHPDEREIGTYKWEDYAIEKNQQNPLAGFGNVDLIYTGSLVAKLALFKQNKALTIFSKDEKYRKLAKKYGEDAFGLTQEQSEEFIYESYIMALAEIIKITYGKGK